MFPGATDGLFWSNTEDDKHHRNDPRMVHEKKAFPHIIILKGVIGAL